MTSSGAPPFQRYSVLGSEVQALAMTDLSRSVQDAVTAGRRLIVGHHNAHSIFIYHHSPPARRFYDLADLIHVDGMSLIFIARLAGLPLRREHRTTYVDWIHPLLELAAQCRWRVFHLGGRPEVAERLAAALAERHPDLEFRLHHGYFDHAPASLENRRVVEQINAFEPHLLLVGMGTPLQESWIVGSHDRVGAPVLITCGACMDYVAGAIPTPPRWLAGIGLEWLARLVAEPRRLAGRYLVEPWFLLRLLGADLLARLRS